MIKLLSDSIKICWNAALRLIKERYTYHASALAFITLLTLVPLLSVIVSVISLFPIFTNVVDLAKSYIIENFIPTSSNVIAPYLENFIQQATNLSKVGIIFLFLTTGAMIVTIEHTLNEIWQAPDTREKYISWFIYWLVLLLAPPFIGISIFISSYLLSVTWFSGMTSLIGIKSFLIAGVPILINTLIFSTLYIVIPRYRIKWRDGIFGGCIAAILFEAAKFGFALYLKQFPHYALIYGALAAIPIFLVWIYIAWLIILYGALITHTQYQLRQKHIAT